MTTLTRVDKQHCEHTHTCTDDSARQKLQLPEYFDQHGKRQNHLTGTTGGQKPEETCGGLFKWNDWILDVALGD
jgi:hypothetical protein